MGAIPQGGRLITSITDNVESGRSATYTGVYPERSRRDGLARLKTAGTTGSAAYPQRGLSWTYDRYGNRTAQTVTAGGPPLNWP